MNKIYMNLLVTLILIFMTTHTALATSNKDTVIPYDYFYADLKTYPLNISKQILTDYIAFDQIDSSVKYANKKTLTKREVRKIYNNRNINNITDSIIIKFGYTNISTNMKMLPTNDTLHKGDERFDSNQYHRLGTSSPVAILHTSKDKKFYFVQADIMRGWVKVEDISIYSEYAFKDTVMKERVSIMKDNILIGGYNYKLGDKLPIDEESDTGYRVILPNGLDAVIEKSPIYAKPDIKFDAKKVEELLNSLLNSPYDWGGKNGFRDCSALTRDVFLPFGIDLPRNTSMQAQLGKNLSEKPSSKEDFFQILDHAKAFRTLIFLRGHVIIYAGKKDNDYLIYHSVNKLVNDEGKSVEFYKVVKNKLVDEKFTELWKRVIRIVEI